MTTGLRNTGDFCWINMLTPEPAEAREFFAKVLGWAYDEMPGVGYVVRVGDSRIGGLFDLDGPNTPKGLAPHIGVMVKVESADATCERVKVLGGKAKPPFDVMQNLRMAVCNDPTGAEFDVWEPKAHHGTEVDSTRHGAANWFELITTDVGSATPFYTNLFDWTAEAKPIARSTYTVFRRETVPVAGMMPIASGMDDVRPRWRTYFAVSDAEEAARTAVALGGTLATRMLEGLGDERFCAIISPQRVEFCVVQRSA